MALLLNNMRKIMANNKLTTEKRLNFISYMQIQFNKLKKKRLVLSGALPARPTLEPPPAALQMQLKVLVDKRIIPGKKPEEEKTKHYKNKLDEKDKSA